MRVLIADDDYQVRGALRLMIEQQFESVVFDEISNLGPLVEVSLLTNPDLILIDWELPGGSQYDLLRQVRNRCPNTLIVVLSALPESKKEALRCGAAFISKNDPPETFIALIKRMSERQTPVAIAN
jgi:two-component system, LuxR family, secretion system response regulator SsrB